MIRQATPQDFEALSDVYKKAFSTHNIFSGEQGPIVAYLDKKSKENHLFVVDQDGVKGGGLISLRGSSGTHSLWRLNHIAIHPDHAGQGYGKALMQYVDEFISKQDYASKKVELGLGQDEEDVIAFYEKFGFKVEGRLPHHYRYNEDTILMGKLIE